MIFVRLLLTLCCLGDITGERFARGFTRKPRSPVAVGAARANRLRQFAPRLSDPLARRLMLMRVCVCLALFYPETASQPARTGPGVRLGTFRAEGQKSSLFFLSGKLTSQR